jgi:HlyD family secretion protein
MKSGKVSVILSIFIIFSACSSSDKEYTISESGTVETDNIVISSQVSGEVLLMNVIEGAYVHVGDTLAIIDTEMLEIRLRQAAAAYKIANAKYSLLKNGARVEDLKLAESQMRVAQSNFDLLRMEKERVDNLFKSNSISKNKVDEVNTRYDIARAQLDAAIEQINKLKNFARPEELAQAEANVENSRANIDLIKKSISDSYISSPIEGYVVKKFINVGETVTPLSSLFKITDLNIAELYVYVSQVDLGRVKLGQSAKVSVDSFPDKTFEGTVVYISPEAEFTPKTIQTKEERTKLVYAVKIHIQNPTHELKAGMPADAEIMVN